MSETTTRNDAVAGHEIDWERLRATARSILDQAYVPYSEYPVAVAALTDGGEIVTGINVENASYGLTLCAECTLVSKLMMLPYEGKRPKLVAAACVQRDGEVVTPCGRCRQLLFEHAAPGLLIDTVDGPQPITVMLPYAFGPADLEA